MNRRGRTSACAVLALLAVTTACGTDPGSGRSDTARPEPGGVRACPTGDLTSRALPTVDGTPANTPEARALAEAVDPPKRGTGANAAYYDTYSSMTVDQPVGRVALCVTDLDRGRAWAAAVAKAHPKVDVSRLDLYRGRWSAKEVEAASERIWRHQKQYAFPIRTTGHDGATGLTVGTTAAGAKSKDFRERLARDAGPVAVRVEAVDELRPADGGDMSMPTAKRH
ncbi:hypothetical protein [Streptomyces sp. NPDC048442]|uniref:hypothetical protein n=1 Tax=Streptomyces sp. NPDC048442 TaxID=3154823 RepID=UPI00343E2B0B